jgi:hypothetical protein
VNREYLLYFVVETRHYGITGDDKSISHSVKLGSGGKKEIFLGCIFIFMNTNFLIFFSHYQICFPVFQLFAAYFSIPICSIVKSGL